MSEQNKRVATPARGACVAMPTGTASEVPNVVGVAPLEFIAPSVHPSHADSEYIGRHRQESQR